MKLVQKLSWLLENNTECIDKLAAKINANGGGNNSQPIQLTVQIGEEKIASQIINLINEKPRCLVETRFTYNDLFTY